MLKNILTNRYFKLFVLAVVFCVIAIGLWRYATNDLRQTIEQQQAQIAAQTALMQQQTALIGELSARPTYSIHNEVDAGKKKNNIVLIPESNLNVSQANGIKHPPDLQSNKR